MGFRILRLHGHQVSSGEFQCSVCMYTHTLPGNSDDLSLRGPHISRSNLLQHASMYTPACTHWVDSDDLVYLTDVFRKFERNGEFFCFVGQSTEAVTGMFNLYRASQVAFPGEKILEDAKQFSAKFLREKRAANELVDKWIIMKNLPEEVRI